MEFLIKVFWGHSEVRISYDIKLNQIRDNEILSPKSYAFEFEKLIKI